MTVLELGIAFQSDKLAEEYAELGAMTDLLGFDTISVYADLFYGPPLLPLLIMAQHTKRVRLGPACFNPFLLHPVEIAGQIAALDEISNGRAFLGLARGAWLGDLGIEPRQPLVALRDAFEIVSRLLAGDRHGYVGRYFHLQTGAGLRTMPLRSQVSFMLGTWGRQGTTLAARYAAELKVGGSANPDMADLVRSWLANDLVRAGRRTDAVKLVMGAVTVVDEDGVAARDRARHEVAMYLDVVGTLDRTFEFPVELAAHLRTWIQNGSTGDAYQAIPDDILDRFAFAGTPDQIVHQVQSLVSRGVGRIEFGTPHGLDERHGVRLLGEQVLPAVKDISHFSENE